MTHLLNLSVDLSTLRKHVWHYDARLQAQSSTLASIMEGLGKMRGSKWVVRKVPESGGEPPAAVGPAAVGANPAIIRVTGMDTVRAWIEQNRRIVNNAGAKVWTLAQPIM